MKRIINGKLYNTETARLIAKSETTTDHSDLVIIVKKYIRRGLVNISYANTAMFIRVVGKQK